MIFFILVYFHAHGKARGPVSLFGVWYETGCLCDAMDMYVDFSTQVSRSVMSEGDLLLLTTIHGQSVGKIRVNPLDPYENSLPVSNLHDA